MMKVECPNCGAVYQIDDSKIPDKGGFGRCPKCQTRFLVNKETKSHEGGPSGKTQNTYKGKRILCSDGSCIGVIGPDGHCTECGKPLKPMQKEAKKELERKKIGSKSTMQFVPYRWVFLAFVVVLVLIGAWVWYVSEHPTTSSGNRSKQEIPQITQEIQSLAIEQIKGYPRVRDAEILQKGDDITLVLVVDYLTSESQAKQHGDDFVRMVKAFSQDTDPGKRIGKGIYTYSIGVFYPNEKRIAIGAKNKYATGISWW